MSSAERARTSTESLPELGNETKLVKPRHRIVVDHFPTQGLDLGGNVRLDGYLVRLDQSRGMDARQWPTD